MDPAAIAALVNLGVGGIGLYLFVTDKLITKKSSDERAAAVSALYEAAIAERDDRIRGERARGDEWRGLALGTEKRLDVALPVVASAVAPVASAATPVEAGK